MDLTMHGVTECTLRQEHFDGGGEPDALRYPKEKSESYKSRYPERWSVPRNFRYPEVWSESK